MIKSLRTIFIKISILSIGFVLFVIIIYNNLSDFIRNNHSADIKLNLIAENVGTFLKYVPDISNEHDSKINSKNKEYYFFTDYY